MKNIKNFLLINDVTVGELQQWMISQNEESKSKIIRLIHHRFNNRYVKHLKTVDSGFLKMAVSCLMIETMESFRQGKKDTKATGVGKKMFKDFFETEQILFPGFKDIYSDFYYNIRCGILHQAETKNAWRILRKDSLLDKTEKTINSTKFVNALEKALDNYVNELKSNDFNSTIWKNALLKLDTICENCQASN